MLRSRFSCALAVIAASVVCSACTNIPDVTYVGEDGGADGTTGDAASAGDARADVAADANGRDAADDVAAPPLDGGVCVAVPAQGIACCDATHACAGSLACQHCTDCLAVGCAPGSYCCATTKGNKQYDKTVCTALPTGCP